MGKLPLPEPPRQFVPAQPTLLALMALPIEEDAVLTLNRTTEDSYSWGSVRCAHAALACSDSRAHGARYGLSGENSKCTNLAWFDLDRLPALHRDPFARLLVCQALTHGLVIVSPDPQIQQYSVATLW